MSSYPYHNPYEYANTNSYKPKIFVSYHHDNDQQWYDLFSQKFSNVYEVFTDNSLDRRIDSDDSDYVKRVIREKNITGSSITIVLCGQETWKRRWVDWEIQMTLNKQHALLGVVLPTCALDFRSQLILPDRLSDNINSGYAYWMNWPYELHALAYAISSAKDKAKYTSQIDNHRPAMQRSKS